MGHYSRFVSRGDCYSWSLQTASEGLVSAPLGLEFAFFLVLTRTVIKHVFKYLLESSLSQTDLKLPNTRDNENTSVVPDHIPMSSTDWPESSHSKIHLFKIFMDE